MLEYWSVGELGFGCQDHSGQQKEISVTNPSCEIVISTNITCEDINTIKYFIVKIMD